MTKESALRVRLYSDGSCLGTPGPGGWAFRLEYNGKQQAPVVCEKSGSEPDTTNNRMEMQAVLEGLRQLKQPCQVEIFTDSRYVKDCLSKWIDKWRKNGWKTSDKKPVKNQDLIRAIDELAHYHDLSWKWVEGHSGHPQNEACDRAAGAAARSLKSRLDSASAHEG